MSEERGGLGVASASVPACAWQPIATAPKGGTLVLIWNGNEGVASMAYFSLAGWSHVAAGDLAFDDEGKPQRNYEAPTHWMPLPPPPVSSRANLADATKKETP